MNLQKYPLIFIAKLVNDWFVELKSNQYFSIFEDLK